MKKSPPPLPRKQQSKFNRRLIIISISVFFLIIITVIVLNEKAKNDERKRQARIEYEERQAELRYQKAVDNIESTMRSDLRRCFQSSEFEEYDIYEDGNDYILEIEKTNRVYAFWIDEDWVTFTRKIRYDSDGNYKRCLEEDKYYH